MSLFEPNDPFAAGFLPVDGGHEIYWTEAGHPGGTPALVVHGGPGSGSDPAHRRLFDPQRYLTVQIDQRGCGRSTQQGRLEDNTLAHLVSDIERVRDHLGIAAWLVVGGSWGSTLALKYAETHPERCTGIILWGVWLCRPADLDWWLYGVRSIFPDSWERFAGHVGESEPAAILDAYARLVEDPDPAIHMPAAVAWKGYERSYRRLVADAEDQNIAADRHTLTTARIMVHYFRHGAFLEDDELCRHADRLDAVPGALVHGRYDMVCPLDGVYRLSQRWTNCKLRVIPDAGHALQEPPIEAGILEAIAAFAEPTRR